MLRFKNLILLLVLAAFCQASPAAEKAAAKKPVVPAIPKHDPADQLFRRAPMASATRSVVLPLSSNVNLSFDAELLRSHLAWRGQNLNLYGPPYHGSSDRFICDFDGQTLWTTPQIFPWSMGELPDRDSKKLPPGTAFKGVSVKDGKATLMYELNFGSGSVRVHESPSVREVNGHDVLVRRLEIAPSEKDLFLLVHAEPGTFVPKRPAFAPVLDRSTNQLLVTVKSTGKAELLSTNVKASYTEILNLEKNGKGPQSIRKTNAISRMEARVYLRIPARTEAIAVELSTVVFSNQAILPELDLTLGNGAIGFPNLTAATEVSQTSRPFSAREFSADKTFFPRLSGDKSYKIEHFPLPKEADLRVTGMDFLPNGDLAVCTWAGEVYIVRQAQSGVQNATYQRFARGLMEPMGLKFVDGQLYILQKCELTRLTDTDGNGEADLYEAINSAWGFTGRYNHFAFGPELDNEGNFCVFIGGNGVFWDVPYMGWAAKISRDGKVFEPFASGLRVPHGFAAYGKNRDIFITENQGNWIGACKLNHVQKGKFYGFPSAWPAPAEKFERTNGFTPPAIWFPYTLAKSASGIVVIPDDKLGPFQGQMIVADYQLSVLTRVMLEQVNGEWQGAVWPFAKGFLSGLNRVAIGPDGKIYVGGGKGAHWAGAVGPQMYSLDRVSFTGTSPFEVKEVHAKSDGLELTFTQPVEAEMAGKADGYDVAQHTYKYHSTYGSPEIDHDGKENSSTEIKVVKATVSEDRLKVRLFLEGWRAGYVTMVRALDVANDEGELLRHNTFWYTLNQIPLAK